MSNVIVATFLLSEGFAIILLAIIVYNQAIRLGRTYDKMEQITLDDQIEFGMLTEKEQERLINPPKPRRKKPETT